MLCGLGVPSLRSLWGAVRNRQLYILRMYCKGWISFNFSIFFIIYTTYSKKKKNYTTYSKKKKIQFFFIIHTTYSKKKKITRIYSKKKKLHDYTVFLYTTYIFHAINGGWKATDSGCRLLSHRSRLLSGRWRLLSHCARVRTGG